MIQSELIASPKFFFHAADRFLYHDVKAAVGEIAGIYRLHVTDGAGAFLSLPRLLETDPNGVIYVGTAGKVNERLGELQKALSIAYGREQWTNSRHGILGKLRTLPRFIERFPYERLCVTIQPFKMEPGGESIIGSDHYSMERQILEDYRRWFGEYPTLNVH